MAGHAVDLRAHPVHAVASIQRLKKLNSAQTYVGTLSRTLSLGFRSVVRFD